jgi:hypothetical protein
MLAELVGLCTVRIRLMRDYAAAARSFARAVEIGGKRSEPRDYQLIEDVLAKRTLCRRIRDELKEHRREHGC